MNVSINAFTNLRFKFKTIRIKEVKQSDYLFIWDSLNILLVVLVVLVVSNPWKIQNVFFLVAFGFVIKIKYAFLKEILLQ